MNTTVFNEVERVWSGAKIEFEIDKNQNFGEIILQKLTEDSDRVMQINGDTDEGLTKAEVRRRTIRCAQNLTKLGCTQNQQIAIIARNHHNLSPLMIAAFCIGSPISPLDVIIAKDGASHILKRLEPSFIFADADVVPDVNKCKIDIGLNTKIFTVDGKVEGFDSIDSLMEPTGNEEDFVCAKIDDAFSHPALIACSSGTTGLSKSICSSHAALTYVFTIKADVKSVVNLCFSSLYWVSGIWSLITSAMTNTRIFTTQSFSSDLFFDLVEKYEIQGFVGPPCQVQTIAKSDRCRSANLSSLLLCVSVGGLVPSILTETLKELIPHLNFITMYGMTEAGGGVTSTIPRELEQHPSTVGRLIAGVHVKIINEKTNEKCGIGEEGELFIKCPIPIWYFRDEVATQNAFDEEGYFITGDIGYFDESGRLYISGRKKEMFKNQGFAILPSEIEDIIQKNRAVRFASIINVYDEEIMSDLVAAVVVKNETYSITADEIYSIIANELASYKRLDGGVYFVDELPMTPSGKVIRSKVKGLAQTFYRTKKQQQNSASKTSILA